MTRPGDPTVSRKALLAVRHRWLRCVLLPLLELDMSPEQVVTVARATAACFRRAGFPRIPADGRIQQVIGMAARNQQMLEAFDGRNYQELAVRYGVDRRTVRRIVDRSGSADYSHVQAQPGKDWHSLSAVR